MTGIDEEVAHEYAAASRRSLAEVEAHLLALELDGAEMDQERVMSVLRALHAVQAGAESYDLTTIRALARQAEHAIALVRGRRLATTPETVNILLRAVDRLGELLDNPQASGQADITCDMARLARLCAEDGYCAGCRTRRAERSRPATGELRALLVEDDFASRLLLQNFLARFGSCHVAVNGREAVAAFGTALESGAGYHLICMDIMMPEMDGREAVRRIRSLEEACGTLPPDGVRIIMTTTVGDLKEVSRCFHELCDAYLVKPLDLGQLLRQMRSYGLAVDGGGARS